MKFLRFEYKITILYLLIGGLWILFSDRLLNLLINDNSTLSEFQTYKGWFYVVLTGLIFFFFIKKHLNNHRNTEKALHDSERKLKAIFDHHFQLTGLIDINGRLQAANQTAIKFLDIKESEIIGRFFWDTPFWTESQKQIVKEAFVRAAKGDFVRFETFHTSSNGKVRNFDFSFKPIKDDNSKVIYVVPEGRDITEIKNAEETLKENEQRLRNLSDNLPLGMTYEIDLGKKGEIRKFTYVSAGVEKIHEISVDEVLNSAEVLYKQVLKEDLEILINKEKIALKTMSPFFAEIRFLLPSGNIKWHFLASAPRRSIEGNIIFDGLEIDISERKEAEFELEKYRNHLEKMVDERTKELNETIKTLKNTQAQLIQSEKMASLGILTTGVAHEINNPLNYIMGSYSGLKIILKEQLYEDVRINKLLKNLKIGVDRAANIVKGLNQFSRNQENFDEECDIHTIIDNCLLMLNSQLKDSIEIKKDYTEELPNCIGNTGKLHQVFINILTNAIQAIETDGKIYISTKKLKNFISIEIADTGCGISKENSPKILDPFFTTKDPGKGTGLGLSITYTIIKEHNGSLDFSSELNNGTKVKIELPIK